MKQISGSFLSFLGAVPQSILEPEPRKKTASFDSLLTSRKEKPKKPVANKVEKPG